MARKRRKNRDSYLIDFDGTLTSKSDSANKVNSRIESLKQYAYENKDKFPNANKKLNGDNSPKRNKGK